MYRTTEAKSLEQLFGENVDREQTSTSLDR
jgi:hypothetical protein